MFILTEKPSVAKDFAKALGCTYSNGVYKNATTTITNCIGYLFSLEEPAHYGTEIPIIPEKFDYLMNPAVEKQARLVIKTLHAHRSDSIPHRHGRRPRGRNHRARVPCRSGNHRLLAHKAVLGVTGSHEGSHTGRNQEREAAFRIQRALRAGLRPAARGLALWHEFQQVHHEEREQKALRRSRPDRDSLCH